MTCPKTCAEKSKLARWTQQARLAQAVYEPMESRIVDGFEEVTDPVDLAKLGLNTELINPSDSKFRAAVFRKTGTADYTVVFKGTTPTSADDWWANLVQGTGNESAYYSRAQLIARRISDSGGPDAPSEVTFVGHSLGGGLASAAAVATGRPATTFNAAGLHENTVAGGMCAPIDAVRVKGEILSTLQSLLPIPEAASTDPPYALDPPPLGLSMISRVSGVLVAALANVLGPAVALGVAARSVQLHTMSSVVEALGNRVREVAPLAEKCGC